MEIGIARFILEANQTKRGGEGAGASQITDHMIVSQTCYATKSRKLSSQFRLQDVRPHQTTASFNFDAFNDDGDDEIHSCFWWCG